MTVGPLILELIVVFCIALILLHHYGRITQQHPIVTVATLTAWYFSLIIVFILPLDVSSTFYRQCIHDQTSNVVNFSINTSTLPSSSSHVQVKARRGGLYTITATPSYNVNITHQVSTDFGSSSTVENSSSITVIPVQQTTLNYSDQVTDDRSYSNNAAKNDITCEKPWSYVPDNTLPSMWRIVYWTSQLLTWLILPFMQSYACAGDFSVLGKLKRAVIENAFYYGSYILIFIALLIYVAASPSISLNVVQLKVLLITAANTWGLFLLVLLLGYGLVEIPRVVWHASDIDRSLAQNYFRIANLSTEKQEAVEDLDDVLDSVKKLSTAVQYNHPSRKYVNIIISKCPEDFQNRVSQGMDDFQDYNQNRSDVPPEKNLVKLHRKVIQAVHTEARTSIQWQIVIHRVLHLETIKSNLKSIDRTWRSDCFDSDDRGKCSKAVCNPTTLWYWYCIIQPRLRKALALCLCVVSAMVVWSECTFFTQNPVLSLFAVFINLAKRNYDYFYIEFASCLIISYLCVCAYYTVFRIKFFNYYYIAGHHQTDEASLLFVGIMLCRLTAPLCLNFLGMIHLDTHIAGETGVETSYTKIMGHLDVISFISDGFNIYFPILVCVLCAATYFNLGQRCLSAIGFQRFIDAADDLTSDMVDEGRQLLSREKRNRQRQRKALERAEWKQEHGNEGDITTRQWKGKRMQNSEKSEAAGSFARYSKAKTDKVELLDDVGPTDYSSFSRADNENDITRWEKPSRWSSSKQSAVSGRPPKNIFDDV